MVMRLHEIHPSLSHFPIAFLPASVVADLVGTALDNDSLLTCGRVMMPAAAGAALLAGAAGLIAQEEVRFDDEESRSMLWVHRNLNIVAAGASVAMAAYRLTRRKPSTSYLVGGLAAIGVVSYSAYLGGKMVYQRGVGVEDAGGVRYDQSLELRLSNLGQIVGAVGRQLRSGFRRTIEGFMPGDDVLPSRDEIQESIEPPQDGAGAGPIMTEP